MARADAEFARDFVQLVVDTAERDGAKDNARRFSDRGIPPDISCRAEEHLRDTDDIGLGRVDLRFDGTLFTLFVENKLYSGYGDEQVSRYLRALKRLPPEGRSALVAITRTVPTYGEPALDSDPRWLGSLRWARMLDGLRDLSVGDSRLREQWPLFLDVLDQQGDLGMTTADAELIRAWARYRDGRAHLEGLLDQVWARASEVVQREMVNTYQRRAKKGELADIYRRGKKRQVVVQRDQTRVFLGFCIPAIVKTPALLAQFSGWYGVPHFTVQVEPWNAIYRLDEDDRALAKASDELRAAGFTTNGNYWARVHEPDEYLHADDVPTRLLELIEQDVPPIIQSRILDYDVELGLSKSRGGPPRHRKVPTA
jgi:hypothetical protein